MDIFAMALDPYVIDDHPGYLDIPDRMKSNTCVYREELHELASAAVERFQNNLEAVKWFEKEIRGRYRLGLM